MEILIIITLSILVLAWFFLTIKAARNEGYSKGYIDGYKAQQDNQINSVERTGMTIKTNNHNGNTENT